MAEKIDLSIVIVSYNTKELLVACIQSVKKFTKGITIELIVVDNASGDGSWQKAEELGARVIKNRKNLGFGQANNQGMAVSRGKYILLLNSDTKITSNVLGEMVKYLDEHSEIGIASCMLRSGNGNIQGTGGYFPTLLRVFAWMSFLDDLPFVSDLITPFHPMHERSPLGANEGFYKSKKQIDWVTGAFFIMRKKVFESVGLFDKDYFMYVEEVDYCYRAKQKGWEIWYLPEWSIIHYGGGSSEKGFSVLSEVESIKTFYKKHYPSWQYNILRLILKFGALIRLPIFGKTYAKILITA